MTAFIALLRAVNVGGNNKLPMTDLKALCEDRRPHRRDDRRGRADRGRDGGGARAQPVRGQAAEQDGGYLPRRGARARRARCREDEETMLGSREIYAYYPSGLGRSKLKISAARHGTARNMNTVAVLVKLAVSL
jgi:Protein of unknown function (DUF1697)